MILNRPRKYGNHQRDVLALAHAWIRGADIGFVCMSRPRAERLAKDAQRYIENLSGVTATFTITRSPSGPSFLVRPTPLGD